MSGSEFDEQVAMTRGHRTSGYNQPTVRGPREGSNGALNIAGVTHVDRTQLYSK